MPFFDESLIFKDIDFHKNNVKECRKYGRKVEKICSQ